MIIEIETVERWQHFPPLSNTECSRVKWREESNRQLRREEVNEQEKRNHKEQRPWNSFIFINQCDQLWEQNDSKTPIACCRLYYKMRDVMEFLLSQKGHPTSIKEISWILYSLFVCVVFVSKTRKKNINSGRRMFASLETFHKYFNFIILVCFTNLCDVLIWFHPRLFVCLLF